MREDANALKLTESLSTKLMKGYKVNKRDHSHDKMSTTRTKFIIFKFMDDSNNFQKPQGQYCNSQY